MSDRDELDRALFAWYNARGQYPAGPACDQALYEVVGRTFMPFHRPGGNRPDESKPFTQRAWGQIPAGWFVQHPTSGEWLEIASTSRTDDGRQEVTFKPAGRSIRPAAGMVPCLPGIEPSETDRALTLLGPYEIIEDQVS